MDMCGRVSLLTTWSSHNQSGLHVNWKHLEFRFPVMGQRRVLLREMRRATDLT